MNKSLRVLVFVMSSGENELEACLRKLTEQSYRDYDLFRIKDLDNKNAHELLYSTINNNRDKYQLFVKVDADMVFMDNFSLCKIVDEFVADPQLDYASFPVIDWYSQKSIVGMHAFSRNCFWEASKEALFVDPDPKYPGKRVIFWSAHTPIASHSPNPSRMQSLQFGFHRALKVRQVGEKKVDLQRAYFQLDLLRQVYEHSLLNSDERLKLVCYGAAFVLKGNLSSSKGVFTSRNDEIFNDILNEYNAATKSQRNRYINSIFGSGRLKIGLWLNIIIFKLWVRFIIQKIGVV